MNTDKKDIRVFIENSIYPSVFIRVDLWFS